MNTYVLIALFCLAVCMFVHGILARKERNGRGAGGHHHGGSVISVDYYAYASSLRKWNAVFKTVFAISCVLLCIMLNNIYVSVTVILFMGYLTVVWGGMSFHHYISMMLIPVVFLIFGSIAIAVGFSLKPEGQYYLSVFRLFYIYCSKESLLQAARLVLKALGAVSALYMLTLTTPLGELISVLRKAHVPKVLIELMNMIYRYIFIMLDTHSRMKNSSESRLGSVDFKTACYSFGQMAGNLLIVSLKRGNDYYNALESRCYDGELRFLEEKKPVRIRHIICAAVFFIVLILIWIITGGSPV